MSRPLTIMMATPTAAPAKELISSTNNVILVVKDLHPTYFDVTMTTTAGTVVAFYPNGTGSTASINFTAAAGTRAITVSAAGRVKVSG